MGISKHKKTNEWRKARFLLGEGVQQALEVEGVTCRKLGESARYEIALPDGMSLRTDMEGMGNNTLLFIGTVCVVKRNDTLCLIVDAPIVQEVNPPVS